MSSQPQISAQSLITKAFSVDRDPRSPEYKAGVFDTLNWHLYGIRDGVPYPPGTAQADAFYSGREEGLAICKRESIPLRSQFLESR